MNADCFYCALYGTECLVAAHPQALPPAPANPAGNKIKIHRIVAATDPGYVVNPAQIKRQVSGSFVYGLSALFEEEITIKNGAVIQKNFDTFGSIRLAQMPPVETIIIQGGGTVWGGVGEPTICVAAPAVLNAFFKATGKRIRTLPLKNSGITLV